MTLLLLACADSARIDHEPAPEAARLAVDRPAETIFGRDLGLGIAAISGGATFSESGANAGDALGTSLAAGDFDGDGTPEVAAGAPGYDGTGAEDGAVYLLSEGSLAIDQVGTGGLGAALAAGDVDGDGDDDLAAASDSTVYLFAGSGGGLGLSSWSYTDGDASVADALAAVDLDNDGSAELYVGASGYDSGAGRLAAFASLDASPSSTVDGNSGEGLGTALSRASDADGDGFEELLVGSEAYSGTFTGEGAVYVYGGGSFALSQAVTGGSANFGLGVRVADGGDSNGDGYGDLWVAARLVSGSGDDKGRVLLYEGSASGYESAAQMSRPGASGDALGSNGIAGGVDIDFDGYDDLLASIADLPGIVVYYGAASGVSATNASNVALASTTGASNSLGVAVAAPDLDGDGYGEFIVGDPGNFSSGTSGDAYGWVGVFEGYADRDGDGYSGGATGGDCDDADASVYPTASEVVGDGIDNNCDGFESCYLDADGDGYGSTSTIASADEDCTAIGESANADDCDDTRANAYPGATEVEGDGIDNDCDGVEGCFEDLDGDGYGSTTPLSSSDGDCDDAGEAVNDDDCDDSDATVYPTATETTADGIDSDCNGYERCHQDTDGDGAGGGATTASADLTCTSAGLATAPTDCDDTDASIYPSATEVVADGVDQNCNGMEDCYFDNDGDRYGYTATINSSDTDCDDSNESGNDDDCDDTSASVYPGAGETPGDGIDSNCDSVDDCFTDADGDGFGGGTSAPGNDLDCSDAGEAMGGEDCDDSDAAVSPATPEVPGDGIDNDCNGADECYTDADGDGFGVDLVANDDGDCTDSGEASSGGDCEDANAAVNPGAPEIDANGIDDNCDGIDGCYVDADGDGFGGAETTTEGCGDAGTSLVGGDCDDSNAALSPAGTEYCNLVDDDCDGETDEDAVDPLTWYADADSDAYGDPATSVLACDSPEGHVADATDCDDTNAAAFPGAVEDCAGSADLDCDGLPAATDDDCAGDSGEAADTGEPDEPGGDDNGDKGGDKGGDTDGCGCNGGAGAGGVAVLLALATTARRRKPQ
ncbi:MAG: VCBS repeat-containing protein [Deltaproteobacteria bacterium]|nr:VCBS repeat-containing protein [Deltaproteobacteria bacterium]